MKKALTKEQKEQRILCKERYGFDDPTAVCGVYLWNREICPSVCNYSRRMNGLEVFTIEGRVPAIESKLKQNFY